jgi:flagellar protein FliS
MLHNPNTNKTTSAINPYLLNNIMNATPQQLLLKVYDFAVVHCQKKDLAKTNSAIQQLKDALRFDGNEEVKEFSLGLFRLYQYCQDQMRKGEFDNALKVLTELRECWSNTLNT